MPYIEHLGYVHGVGFFMVNVAINILYAIIP